MTKFALKGLLGRKLRTALTALAIVLGVAMISGTYVLTDSIDSAFDTIFTEVRKGSSAVSRARPRSTSPRAAAPSAPAFDESVLETVRGVEGVAPAEGSVDSESTTLIGRDGKAVVNGGAPNLGFAIANGESPFNPLALVEGDWPGPNEVVIDTRHRRGRELRDRRVDRRPGRRCRSSGSGLRLRPAERLDLDRRRHPRRLRPAHRAAAVQEGGQARRDRRRGLRGHDRPAADREHRRGPPRGTQVRTGEAQAADDASETNEFITFLQGFLLAFAGIALFVGSFVIANSLSITIAQRAREFATVRTLGGSRRQILGSIVIEALVVGVAASVIGLFLGLGLAKLLFWLFDLVGFTLPNSGLLFETRTIVVSLLVGIIVTLLASLRPGAPRDARAPDRSRARGRDAARVALRPLPHGRLARC